MQAEIARFIFSASVTGCQHTRRSKTPEVERSGHQLICRFGRWGTSACCHRSSHSLFQTPEHARERDGRWAAFDVTQRSHSALADRGHDICAK
ncbi:hypothetical protein PsYK624_087380 [Phanerochaete sordida]|uniref:Uncharacterized protein n=1 Tax=Phanerochaete sordida TaxID=48140 RepID=A0A9P3GAQ8_9APHY|nr:hypothetical protein PsYK624_087380 [Phanerochaete sordida]